MLRTSLPSVHEMAIIAAPFGSLVITAKGGFLLDIQLNADKTGLTGPDTPFLREVTRQFNAYFDNPRRSFSLTLPTLGSAYQRSVWQIMATIPPGSAKSYGTLAKELHSSPRAVAGACRANRLPIVIPCHRIVASHGLGGYCGATDGPYLDIKRWLLRHEGYELA